MPLPRTPLNLRLATAGIGVPLLFGITYLGGPLYGLLITVAAGFAAWEAREMIRAAGHQPVDPVIIGLAAFLPFQAWFLVTRVDGEPLFGPDGMVVVAVAVMGSLLLPMLRSRLDGSMVDWALSLAMALWLGGLLQFYGPLRDRPDGTYWVISAVGLSFICDTTAYFVGRAAGRTRLAPNISPKKSLEGAVAGLVITVLVGAGWAVVAALVFGISYPPVLLAGYGAAIGIATISGDLAESLLKRQTGVKDSGVLIPGHGGILDRMDSLLFCGPVAVLYLTAFL